ncbi:MAG: hypothetical protein Q9173_000744 [Seirophora scorigena]
MTYDRQSKSESNRHRAAIKHDVKDSGVCEFLPKTADLSSQFLNALGCRPYLFVLRNSQSVREIVNGRCSWVHESIVSLFDLFYEGDQICMIDEQRDVSLRHLTGTCEGHWNDYKIEAICKEKPQEEYIKYRFPSNCKASTPATRNITSFISGVAAGATVCIYVSVYKEYLEYIRVRQLYFSSPQFRSYWSDRTVLTISIPRQYSSTSALPTFYGELPGAIKTILLSREPSPLVKKVHQRQTLLEDTSAPTRALIPRQNGCRSGGPRRNLLTSVLAEYRKKRSIERKAQLLSELDTKIRSQVQRKAFPAIAPVL